MGAIQQCRPKLVTHTRIMSEDWSEGDDDTNVDSADNACAQPNTNTEHKHPRTRCNIPLPPPGDGGGDKHAMTTPPPNELVGNIPNTSNMPGEAEGSPKAPARD